MSLAAGGSYLVFWGFEIMQSHPTVVVDRVLEANTADGKFINLILYDAGFSGVSMGADRGTGVELYGSIIYNNGFRDNIDHGVCAHNATTGTKYITDNVLFNNFARGIQVYNDAGTALQNVSVAGNVSFNNGTIATGSSGSTIAAGTPTIGTPPRPRGSRTIRATPSTSGRRSPDSARRMPRRPVRPWRRRSSYAPTPTKRVAGSS